MQLVGAAGRGFENSAHFFSGAAEALRRNLVENTCGKPRLKHGGGHPQPDKLNFLTTAYERFWWFW